MLSFDGIGRIRVLVYVPLECVVYACLVPAQIEAGSYETMGLVPRLTGDAPEFYEPFGQVAFWTRQSQTISLSAAGQYMVAVWNPDSEAGQYMLVVGTVEQLSGGEFGCYAENDYWFPVTTTTFETVIDFARKLWE